MQTCPLTISWSWIHDPQWNAQLRIASCAKNYMQTYFWRLSTGCWAWEEVGEARVRRKHHELAEKGNTLWGINFLWPRFLSTCLCHDGLKLESVSDLIESFFLLSVLSHLPSTHAQLLLSTFYDSWRAWMSSILLRNNLSLELYIGFQNLGVSQGGSQ